MKRGENLENNNSITEKRNYYIIKGNELVRFAKYKYTAQQLKIYNYAVSKIKKQDKPGTWYELSIDEICRICGFNIDTSGSYYTNIKRDLMKLTERRWVTLPDREVTVSVLSDAEIVPLSGTVYVKFHEKIEPYLFEQANKYTQYKLIEILCFHSKYSIRLFELLKSYITAEEIKEEKEVEHCFKLDELKEILNVDGYRRWYEFDRNVLKVAVKEINEYSETIRVTYDALKRGNTVSMVNFIITGAKPTKIFAARQKVKSTIERKESLQKKRNAKETVRSWKEAHPEGDMKNCIKETGLSKYLVNKYWTDENNKKLEEAEREARRLSNALQENLKDGEAALQRMEEILESMEPGTEKDHFRAEYIKAAESVDALRELINRK